MQIMTQRFTEQLRLLRYSHLETCMICNHRFCENETTHFGYGENELALEVCNDCIDTLVETAVRHVYSKLPYEKPELNTKLWRYMDFTKYVSMLSSSSLFFARADTFDDFYEGAKGVAKNKDKWELQKSDIKELKEYFTKWQNGMEKENGWSALFWCNHDQPRIVSRMGNETVYRYESAAMLATLLHMMQGTPYIYQGEEIGMLNAHFDKITDYEDIESLNAYKNMMNAGKSEEEALKILRERSRDNSRTPVQWDNTENSGFSTGKPWIKMGKMADGINVEEDLKSEKSVFSYYKKLINMRKEYDIIRDGNFTILDKNSEDTFIYTREAGGEILYVICNLTDKSVKIDKEIADSAVNGECLITNTDIPCENGILKPYETSVWLLRK